MDYFLAEEEDAQRVDSVFETPLLPEQEEIFNGIEDEVDEVEKGLPVSRVSAARGQADDRMSTMNVYGLTRLPADRTTSRKSTCSLSWKEVQMRK